MLNSTYLILFYWVISRVGEKTIEYREIKRTSVCYRLNEFGWQHSYAINSSIQVPEELYKTEQVGCFSECFL